jgi:hypothetical protein
MFTVPFFMVAFVVVPFAYKDLGRYKIVKNVGKATSSCKMINNINEQN